MEPREGEEEWVPIGPLLDELGVRIDIDPADRIVDVLVLAKVTDMETGRSTLTVATNDLDWIAQAGLHAAFALIQSGAERAED